MYLNIDVHVKFETKNQAWIEPISMTKEDEHWFSAPSINGAGSLA